MLSVDLKQDDKKIAQLVTLRCAKYGDVLSAKIHRSPTAFAIVEMRSHPEAMELATQVGGSTFGTCVLVHLEQLVQ